MGRAKSKQIKDLERKSAYEQFKYKSFEQKMAEKDTARSIVKNLCQRDATTGEIIYTKENESEIKLALLSGKYCVEKEKLPSPHCKKTRIDRIWFDIDPEICDKMNYVYGEVLNRSVVPCWWR